MVSSLLLPLLLIGGILFLLILLRTCLNIRRIRVSFNKQQATRGCNFVLIGGWYLRMSGAVEACMSSCTRPERPNRPYWQLQWVSRIRPELCGLVRPKMQLKARPNIQPQGHGLESQLCHTEQRCLAAMHWWRTCPGYMPQWLGETCCERGRPREHEHPLPHCKKKITA